MNDDDAERLGIVNIPKLPLFPVVIDRAFIASMGINTRKHLHQRGFSRAVFTHKGMYFARHDGEVHIAQRLHDTEGLVDPTHFKKRLSESIRQCPTLVQRDRIG